MAAHLGRMVASLGFHGGACVPENDVWKRPSGPALFHDKRTRLHRNPDATLPGLVSHFRASFCQFFLFGEWKIFKLKKRY
eukprot:g32984.t1